MPALTRLWKGEKSARWKGSNVYGGANSGQLIARCLANILLEKRWLRKLIAY
jgi:hypothetical protein